MSVNAPRQAGLSEMLRGFDQQHLEHDLARLEQVQERLWQRYLQLTTAT